MSVRTISRQRCYPVCTKKVLLQIPVFTVCQKLLTHQRHEQFGFTLEKSIVDRILALHVFIELLRDFLTGLLAFYVYLHRAFDTVNRNMF